MSAPVSRSSASLRSVPTLADVADRAGVSTATVSRCLNAPDRVTPDTRERVMAAVDALGYAPNFNARALAARRTYTVGAIIPTMDNAIFARGLQAFQEELVRHGYTLFVASSSYKEGLEAEQIRALVARGTDALLLIGYHRDPEVYDFLRQREVPALVAWAYDPAQSTPALGFDNVGAMADLARQVLGQGHRNLAFITAPMASNDRAAGRHAGIRRAMEQAGLDPDALTVVETDYGIDTGAAALRQILATAPATTCVMCGNDVLAVGALRGAKELGLSVPRDLSITGFDDIELAALAEPALTTVHVPHREMGRRAAQTLLQMVEGDAAAASTELATDIRLRQSLGPARES